jgi:hypothetical protein
MTRADDLQHEIDEIEHVYHKVSDTIEHLLDQGILSPGSKATRALEYVRVELLVVKQVLLAILFNELDKGKPDQRSKR